MKTTVSNIVYNCKCTKDSHDPKLLTERLISKTKFATELPLKTNKAD